MRRFAAGKITTAFLGSFAYQRHAIDVVAPGTQTTVQDYPGRLGLWHVGVPPSGPMDALAFRLANRLAGNPEGSAALEIAVTGPALRFNCEATIAVTGADFSAKLDGAPLERWKSHRVPAGSCARVWIGAGYRQPGLPGGRRRHRCAGVSGQPQHIHPGEVRRPRGPHPARRRRAAHRRPAHSGGKTGCPARAEDIPSVRQPMGDWRAVRTSRRARLLYGPGHRHFLLASTGKFTTIPIEPVSGSSVPSHSGHARTAARPASTHRTSTTTPTRSAQSTSRAICR